MLDDVERNGRPGGLRQAAARPRRAADGLRAPRLPGRGPARPRPAAHRARDRSPRFEVAEALEGGARGAARAKAGPGARHERRVLVRRGARPRRGRRRSSSRRCSPARAWPAGRRTSSSRSARAALIRPTAKYVGPPRGRSPVPARRRCAALPGKTPVLPLGPSVSRGEGDGRAGSGTVGCPRGRCAGTSRRGACRAAPAGSGRSPRARRGTRAAHRSPVLAFCSRSSCSDWSIQLGSMQSSTSTSTWLECTWR